MDPKGAIGNFIEIDEISNGYRIWWPNKRSKSVERNIKFLRNKDIQSDITTIDNEQSLENINTSKRIKKPTAKILGKEYNDAYVADFGEDPINYKWAMKEADAE